MLTLKGIVRIYDRDKSGNAIQLYIQTEDFKKYIIENSGLSIALFDKIDEEIILTYTFSYDQFDAIPHIIAESIQLLK